MKKHSNLLNPPLLLVFILCIMFGGCIKDPDTIPQLNNTKKSIFSNGPVRIDQTPVRMGATVTEDRQTPKTDFGSRAVIANSASASVAAPLVPGGAIISGIK